MKKLFGADKITSATLQHVPSYLFDAPIVLVQSFIQGIFDAAGLPPSESSSAFGAKGLARVDLELPFARWYVPVEVCRLLQRRLSIGYARAARLIDTLEKKGYVSAVGGTEPRKVLKSK